MCLRRSLIGCSFVPRDGAVYCAQCAVLDLRVTDDVIRVKVGGEVDNVSASSESLARDCNNVVSRQAAIASSHVPAPPATPFQLHSPDGSSSYFAGCSQDGESPRRGHVTAKGRGGGRAFAASRGTTSRYLDDDDDSDRSEVFQAKPAPALPPRRRQPQPRSSPGRLKPSEWRAGPGEFGNRRRRPKPRTKPRSRALAEGRGVEGYASDNTQAAADGLTPAGDANVRCSGYSSDSLDPNSPSIQQRQRQLVSTAAQTTGNDVTEERGRATGSGSRRLMSEAVRRYLEAAAAWDDERRGACSTCSSSSTDSSSEFDYYLDRPLSTSGLGWSSTSATASPLHAPKCSSAVKQCIVS